MQERHRRSRQAAWRWSNVALMPDGGLQAREPRTRQQRLQNLNSVEQQESSAEGEGASFLRRERFAMGGPEQVTGYPSYAGDGTIHLPDKPDGRGDCTFQKQRPSTSHSTGFAEARWADSRRLFARATWFGEEDELYRRSFATACAYMDDRCRPSASRAGER